MKGVCVCVGVGTQTANLAPSQDGLVMWGGGGLEKLIAKI
jgi:hypothetical protein